MPYQHLTCEKRHTISTLRRNGTKPSQIARQLSRHVSTSNRELRRNATPEGGYQYQHAHTCTRKRSHQASCHAERCSPKVSVRVESFIVTSVTKLNLTKTEASRMIDAARLKGPFPSKNGQRSLIYALGLGIGSSIQSSARPLVQFL